MSFTIKTLRATIALAKGSFGEGNAVTIEGLPMAATVSKPGGADMNKMNLDIKGLGIEKMERLTTLAFRPLQSLNNRIKLEAGDLGGKLGLVFAGEMSAAVPKFETDGNVGLAIEALTGWFPNQIAASPISVKGETTIERLMGEFAAEAGYALKNEGVSGSVKNSIFRGSPILKARTLARQTGIELLIDDGRFVIMERGEAIKGKIPLISKESGLLGYPSFSNDGVDATCIYDGRLEIGGKVEIKSVVPKASGTWKISKLEHKLEAYVPGGGEWLTAFSAVWLGEASK
jgi:hypothetical protein